MNNGVTRLSLHKFRGATTQTTLDLPRDKPLVLICGENGAGKSTLIDALDFVCNKAAGSLADKSSTNAKSHLPALGYKAKDLQVVLTCSAQTWTATHNGKEIVVSGAQPAPRAFILRRARLLRLVEAQPAKQYDELRSFIDVTGIEASEESLRRALNDSQNRFDGYLRQQADADSALREIWELEREPDAAQLSEREWAKAKAAARLAHLQTEAAEIAQLLRLGQDADLQQNDARAAVRHSKEQKTALAQITAEVATQTPTAAAAFNLKLAELLRQTDAYLAAQQGAHECPVCQSPVALHNLRAQIAARLGELRQPDDLSQRLKAAQTTLQNAEAVAEAATRQYVAAGCALARAWQSAALTSVKAAPLVWNDFAQLLSASGPAEAMQSAELLLAAKQASQLLLALAPLRQRLAERQAQLNKDLAQHNAVKQAYERALTAAALCRKEEAVLQRLQQMHKLVHETRIAFTQQILDEVTDECRRLYARLHPDEPYELSALKLDEKRKGSLHQFASFAGVAEVAPQAYFSESHLDTLGFCFWLAVARRASQGDAIIALDDVFTAADDVHLARIAELLVEECGNFRQIIITSHNRRWRELYKQGRLPENKICLVQLAPWNQAEGVRVQEA